MIANFSALFWKEKNEKPPLYRKNSRLDFMNLKST